MKVLNILSCLTFMATAATADPITINDSRGAQSFETAPQRVVVANWGLAETLLTLDVVPVGVADIDGYRAWVAVPEMPESVTDIGQRSEPNFEAILGLQPDLFILADEEDAMLKQVERVAPALHFTAYSEDHDNVAQARATYLELAKLFGKEDLAAQRLNDMDGNLAELKQVISEKYDGTPPKVTVIRMLDRKRGVVYGENSPVLAALDALGLQYEVEVENSRWGLAYKSVAKLGEAQDGKVLNILPFDEADQLYGTKLWQAMPFVANDNYAELPALWTYGGPLSVGLIGQAIADELLK